MEIDLYYDSRSFKSFKCVTAVCLNKAKFMIIYHICVV